MSIPSRGVPPPPEIVHLGPLKNRAKEATGSQPSFPTPDESPRNRKPTPLGYSLPKKSSEPPTDPIFSHFHEEANNVEDATCIFLLWGSANSELCPTWAVDVSVTGIESEEIMFQKLKERYATERGILRKYLSFRKLARLRPVTVRSNDVKICAFSTDV